MAYDEAGAAVMRADMAGTAGLTERKMFGGLCFLVSGNMIGGVFHGGGMYRVGKDAEAAALEVPGVRPMEMGGRRMPGIVHAPPEVLADPVRRARLLHLARGFVAGLSPK